MPWKNFSVWRARLPHWRADEVTYYVTFRHRRPLSREERSLLMTRLLKSSSSRFEILILAVTSESSELMFTAELGKDGRPLEFAKAIEAAKAKAGAGIVKKSGERFPPFYGESFDRIVRDESELEEKFDAILKASEDQAAEDSEEEYTFLYVQNEPKSVRV